jgi:prepilin-type processing-associated H-X9-DG protein
MKAALLIIVSICAVQLTACSKKTDSDSLSTSESIKFLHTIDKSDYIELFHDGTVIRNRTLGPALFTGKYIGQYTVENEMRIIVKYGIDHVERFVYGSERDMWGEGSDIPCLQSVDDRQTFSPEGLRKTYIKNNILLWKPNNQAEDEESGTVLYSQSQLQCMSNLKQIGLALIMYVNENNGRLPKTLEQLLYDYIAIEKTFVCPSDTTSKKTGKDLMISYEYIYTTKLAPQTILAYDRNPQAHGDQGRNALFGDGHTEWISKKDFRTIMGRSLKTLK